MKQFVFIVLTLFIWLMPELPVYTQEPGDAVLMGVYPYGRNGRKKTVEWIILDKEADGTFLLLNSYGIEAKEYNTEAVPVTWKNCTIRKWLNGEFYENIFNEREKREIRISSIHNSTGEDTKDRIFLLSIPEAEKYISPGNKGSVKLRKYVSTVARLTPYAFRRGGDRYRYRHSGARFVSWWWLRSPGNSAEKAAFMGRDGEVYSDGFFVQLDYGAVRAAFRTGLENYVNISRNRQRGLWVYMEKNNINKVIKPSAVTLEISSAPATQTSEK
jgi:hypothetical protein